MLVCIMVRIISQVRQAAIKRQFLACTYLAHHEQESVQIVIFNGQVVPHHDLTMTEAAATFTSEVRESGLQV